MELISRKKAKLLGLTTYFTGKFCKNGHISIRRTDNGCCRECALIVKHRIYDRDKEELNAKARLWKELNADRVREYSREWYYSNKELANAKSKRYRDENPNKVKEAWQNWYINNIDKSLVIQNRRRAAKLQRTPSWSNEVEIKKIYAERLRISNETGILHHVDHIIPLQGKNVCGLHVHYNLQIITAEENISKGNRYEP